MPIAFSPWWRRRTAQPNADPPNPQQPLRRFTRLSKIFGAFCWIQLAAVLVIWILFRFSGDRWWLATALLYGPRWIWGLPLVLLMPASLLLRRQLLWVLLLSTLILLFPIMGFCVSSTSIRGTPATSEVIRVLNCNVDGGSLNAPALMKVISEVQPDVIAGEEFPGPGDAISSALIPLGWHVRHDGGLFVASRFPIVSASPVPSLEGWRDIAVFCVLETPAGNINFVNVHLETPRKGLEALLQGRRSEIQPVIDNIARRRHESEQVSWQAKHLQGPVVIAGDFNLPCDSSIFRENWSQFNDAFSSAGFGFGYTKFTRKWSIRIDHLLVDNHWRVGRCYVGPDVGSDHKPLITELQSAGHS